MSLPHALLTALAEHAGSGSELARRFDRSIGYFWSATHQQIYRELARLEEAGWVQSTPVEASRGKKRAYKILPAGRKELRRWIAEGGDERPLRDALMVRIRAEAAVGPAGLEHDLKRQLAHHRDQRQLYLDLERRDFDPPPTTRERALQHLVLSAGIRYESYWIDFLERALSALALPSGDP